MNPIFVVLVFTVAVLLWFLLVSVFRPLGGLLVKLWKNAVETINDENKAEEKKNE